MGNYTLKKKELLKTKKDIELLFNANKLENELFRVYHHFSSDSFLHKPRVQALFLVPKRNVSKAISRNKIRRRMKEAYRLNKNLLNLSCSKMKISVKIGFVYVSNGVEKYSKIELSLKNHLSCLREIILQPNL